MKNKDLISIIIPVYNAEIYIAETLESALKQTYTNLEIICVDDCSSDNSVKIIEKYSKKYKNITLIKLKENSKTSIARNTGTRNANGKFILPLDADDIIAPTYCEKAIEVFNKNPHISVVYCEANMFDENKSWKWKLPEYSPKKIIFGNMVFCSGFFLKSDWSKLGEYNINMKEGYEDWDFWLKFTENKMKFYRIPEVLFHYRQVPNSRNSVLKDKKKKARLWDTIIKNHPNLYKYYKSKKFINKIIKILFEIKVSNKGYKRIKIFKICIFKY